MRRNSWGLVIVFLFALGACKKKGVSVSLKVPDSAPCLVWLNTKAVVQKLVADRILHLDFRNTPDNKGSVAYLLQHNAETGVLRDSASVWFLHPLFEQLQCVAFRAEDSLAARFMKEWKSEPIGKAMLASLNDSTWLCRMPGQVLHFSGKAITLAEVKRAAAYLDSLPEHHTFQYHPQYTHGQREADAYILWRPEYWMRDNRSPAWHNLTVSAHVFVHEDSLLVQGAIHPDSQQQALWERIASAGFKPSHTQAPLLLRLSLNEEDAFALLSPETQESFFEATGIPAETWNEAFSGKAEWCLERSRVKINTHTKTVYDEDFNTQMVTARDTSYEAVWTLFAGIEKQPKAEACFEHLVRKGWMRKEGRQYITALRTDSLNSLLSPSSFKMSNRAGFMEPKLEGGDLVLQLEFNPDAWQKDGKLGQTFLGKIHPAFHGLMETKGFDAWELQVQKAQNGHIPFEINALVGKDVRSVFEAWEIWWMESAKGQFSFAQKSS